MIVIIGTLFLVYLGAAFAAAATLPRLAPHWYFDYPNETPLRWKCEGRINLALGAVVWPVVIWLALFQRIGEVSRRSAEKKTRMREELEAELAAARREIDDLLRTKRAG